MVDDTNTADCSSSEPETSSAHKVPFQENQQDEEGIRAKKLEIAKVRVKMNELRDQLDDAVSRKDFLVAQEIKGSMDQLDDEQGILEEQLITLKNFGATPSSSEDSSVSVDTIP